MPGPGSWRPPHAASALLASCGRGRRRRCHLFPLLQDQGVSGAPAYAADAAADQLIEGGVGERVATLAAQHELLVAGAQDDRLALALRALAEALAYDESFVALPHSAHPCAPTGARSP